MSPNRVWTAELGLQLLSVIRQQGSSSTSSAMVMYRNNRSLCVILLCRAPADPAVGFHPGTRLSEVDGGGGGGGWPPAWT